MNCSICTAQTSTFASALILGKYETAYQRCPSCGFIRTEEPYWLSDAYSNAITGSDVGLVKRNSDMAAITKVVITLMFDPKAAFVDYAGGYGLFVRLMRDSGYDFSWYDRYCSNLFAGGFVAKPPGSMPIELLTAFEVFEHLVDPVSELEQMLAYSRNILFATQLLPEPAPKPDQWWYYGLEHGQHIAFYTRRSLACLAERAGLHCYTNGVSMHLLSERQLSQTFFYGIARYKTARFLAPLIRHPSLLPVDIRQTAREYPGDSNADGEMV